VALYSADMVPATSPTEPPALGLDAPKIYLNIEGALLTVHRKDGCCQQNNIDVQ